MDDLGTSTYPHGDNYETYKCILCDGFPARHMVEGFHKVLSNCRYHERYANDFSAQIASTARIFSGLAGAGIRNV